MVIVLAAIAGWMLTFTLGLSLAAAAKRGDELAQSARRFAPAPITDAQIIPIDRARSRRQPCRAPIQCSRSCTISSSSR